MTTHDPTDSGTGSPPVDIFALEMGDAMIIQSCFGVDYVNYWVQDRRADTNAKRAEFDTAGIEKALASALTALRAARDGLRDTVTTLELHSALGGATRSLTTLISRLPPRSGKLPLYGQTVFCPLAWANGQSTLDELSETSAHFATVVRGSQASGKSGGLVLRELAVASER